MPTTIERPGTIPKPGTLDIPGFAEWTDIRDGLEITGPWVVILYNCDCHTFDDVIYILCIATGCTVDEAGALADRVDKEGRAIVFDGTQEECERVADIIGSIKLQVETDRA
jgi:ATP-dependent Clp protease adaptor protein ClpS